jgi:hypothetical protein
MATDTEVVLFKDTGDASNGYMVFSIEDPTNPASELLKAKVLFQHLPTNLTDARRAQYNVVPILKRTEPFLVYQSTGFREINFGLTFHARTPQDAYDIFAVSSLFRRSVLPTRRGTPTMIKLFLGSWYINYAMKISGGSYTMVRDGFTEDENGFNAVIESMDLTPSENRFVSQDVTGIAPSPQGWSEKFPSSISVGLGLKVFLSDVWAMDYKANVEAMYNSGNEETTYNPPASTQPSPEAPVQPSVEGTVSDEDVADNFWDNIMAPFTNSESSVQLGPGKRK